MLLEGKIGYQNNTARHAVIICYVTKLNGRSFLHIIQELLTILIEI